MIESLGTLMAEVKIVSGKKHILILKFPEDFTPTQVDNIRKMFQRWIDTFDNWHKTETPGAVIFIRDDLSLKIEGVERIE